MRNHHSFFLLIILLIACTPPISIYSIKPADVEKNVSQPTQIVNFLKATPLPLTKDQLLKNKEKIGTQINKLVLADYQIWYSQSDWTEWRHWGTTKEEGAFHDPNQIKDNGLRDIASVFYPLIGPYDSSDQELVSYHMNFAKALGIDAFVVDWYGANDIEGKTDLAYMDRNFSTMLDLAKESSFRLAILYELKIHFVGWIPHKNQKERIDAIESDLQYVLDKYSENQAYLRIEEIPLIFIFDSRRLSVSE